MAPTAKPPTARNLALPKLIDPITGKPVVNAPKAPSALPGVVSRVAAPVATGITALNEGFKTADDLSVEGASEADKSARIYQAGSRIAGAGLGAQGGAALGALTGPFAPIASPVLGVAGGIAGYAAPDYAIEYGNKALKAMGIGDVEGTPESRIAEQRAKNQGQDSSVQIGAGSRAATPPAIPPRQGDVEDYLAKAQAFAANEAGRRLSLENAPQEGESLVDVPQGGVGTTPAYAFGKSGSGAGAAAVAPAALPKFRESAFQQAPGKRYMTVEEALGKVTGGAIPSTMGGFIAANMMANAVMANDKGNVNLGLNEWDKEQDNRTALRNSDVALYGQDVAAYNAASDDEYQRGKLALDREIAPTEKEYKGALAQQARQAVALGPQSKEEQQRHETLQKLLIEASKADSVEKQEQIMQLYRIIEAGGTPEWGMLQEAQPERGKWNPFVENTPAVPEKYGYRAAPKALPPTR